MEAAHNVELSSDAMPDFERFVGAHEERLRVALVAAYGAADGRAAAVDALSWAWENWSRLQNMDNPVGYLYRVGQTAARRFRSRPLQGGITRSDGADADLEPELIAALSDLSDQQRVAVLLVHGFGWTIRETAVALGIAPSTVQTHAERGLARLRTAMEAHHAC
jgi:DNA-directed RNA polymerase specialized sigma24 family protein